MIKKLLHKEKGAIILMFVVLLPFMLGFVGLAIDFAYIYAEKTKLQNTADAAALAGVVHLKDTDPPVHSYVLSMLDGNDFSATESPATDDLSEAANWKLTYEQEPKDGKPPAVTATPSDATRLRITLLKNIQLVFLPILSSDLATLDLTATAVARGQSDSSYKDEYQFITLGSLILGDKSHIPSYPKNFPFDPDSNRDNIKKEISKSFAYDDYDEFLNGNIYAAQISLGSKSTLRTKAKLYSSSRNIPLDNTNLFVSDPENYEIADNSNAIIEIKKLRLKGKQIVKDATSNNAILIDVDKHPELLTGIGDYGLKNILGKYNFPSNFFNKPDDKTKNGLDIKVPVIFFSGTHNNPDTEEPPTPGKEKKPFFIRRFDISFYNFEEGIIVQGGNIELSGSSNIANAPNGLGITEHKIQYIGDIYVFSDWKKDVPADGDITLPEVISEGGNFLTVTGNIAPKEFGGTVYADSGITIAPANSYRRHTFYRTFATKGNISFPADGSRDSANTFDSMRISTKISLVE